MNSSKSVIRVITTLTWLRSWRRSPRDWRMKTRKWASIRSVSKIRPKSKIVISNQSHLWRSLSGRRKILMIESRNSLLSSIVNLWCLLSILSSILIPLNLKQISVVSIKIGMSNLFSNHTTWNSLSFPSFLLFSQGSTLFMTSRTLTVSSLISSWATPSCLS